MSGARERSAVNFGDLARMAVWAFWARVPVWSGAEEVDALRGAEEFDGEGVAEIGEHAMETARAAHAHGDVVFLIAGGGDGVDGVRRG